MDNNSNLSKSYKLGKEESLTQQVKNFFIRIFRVFRPKFKVHHYYEVHEIAYPAWEKPIFHHTNIREFFRITKSFSERGFELVYIQRELNSYFFIFRKEVKVYEH